MVGPFLVITEQGSAKEWSLLEKFCFYRTISPSRKNWNTRTQPFAELRPPVGDAGAALDADGAAAIETALGNLMGLMGLGIPYNA